MCASGVVDVRGWGFTRGANPLAGVPTRFDEDALREELAAARMGPGGYGVLLEIEARIDPEIELDDGTVLEQATVNGTQTLAAAQRRFITVDAGELRPLVASAWCLNAHLDPPRGEPIRPTPLKVARVRETQDDVWLERDRYRRT